MLRLHRAAADGRTDEVTHLLNQGKDIHGTDNDGRTALHAAAASGKDSAVVELLKRAAKVDAADKDGYTPLHLAALAGDEATIKDLLEHGANVHAVDTGHKMTFFWNPNQCTALHKAASRGHKTVATLLVQHGADLKATDPWGFTPLHVAAYQNYPDVITALVDLGAELNVKDKRGITPLMAAAEKGNTQSVWTLLKQSADSSCRNQEGRSALHLAAAKGFETVVRLLVQQGAPLDAMDRDGQTAVHLAACNGQVAVLQQLLKKKACPKAVDKQLSTPLHEACAKGHIAVVKILLKYGAECNIKDQDGCTPLHRAAARCTTLMVGYEEVATTLIAAGVDVDAANNAGQTALMLAACQCHLSLVQCLLESGADMFVQDKDGRTALDLAIAAEHLPMMELLAPTPAITSCSSQCVQVRRSYALAADEDGDTDTSGVPQRRKSLDSSLPPTGVAATLQLQSRLQENTKVFEGTVFPAGVPAFGLGKKGGVAGSTPIRRSLSHDDMTDILHALHPMQVNSHAAPTGAKSITSGYSLTKSQIWGQLSGQQIHAPESSASTSLPSQPNVASSSSLGSLTPSLPKALATPPTSPEIPEHSAAQHVLHSSRIPPVPPDLPSPRKPILALGDTLSRIPASPRSKGPQSDWTPPLTVRQSSEGGKPIPSLLLSSLSSSSQPTGSSAASPVGISAAKGVSSVSPPGSDRHSGHYGSRSRQTSRSEHDDPLGVTPAVSPAKPKAHVSPTVSTPSRSTAPATSRVTAARKVLVDPTSSPMPTAAAAAAAAVAEQLNISQSHDSVPSSPAPCNPPQRSRRCRIGGGSSPAVMSPVPKLKLGALTQGARGKDTKGKENDTGAKRRDQTSKLGVIPSLTLPRSVSYGEIDDREHDLAPRGMSRGKSVDQGDRTDAGTVMLMHSVAGPNVSEDMEQFVPGECKHHQEEDAGCADGASPAGGRIEAEAKGVTVEDLSSATEARGDSKGPADAAIGFASVVSSEAAQVGGNEGKEPAGEIMDVELSCSTGGETDGLDKASAAAYTPTEPESPHRAIAFEDGSPSMERVMLLPLAPTFSLALRGPANKDRYADLRSQDAQEDPVSPLSTSAHSGVSKADDSSSSGPADYSQMETRTPRSQGLTPSSHRHGLPGVPGVGERDADAPVDGVSGVRGHRDDSAAQVHGGSETSISGSGRSGLGTGMMLALPLVAGGVGSFSPANKKAGGGRPAPGVPRLGFSNFGGGMGLSSVQDRVEGERSLRSEEIIPEASRNRGHRGLLSEEVLATPRGGRLQAHEVMQTPRGGRRGPEQVMQTPRGSRRQAEEGIASALPSPLPTPRGRGRQTGPIIPPAGGDASSSKADLALRAIMSLPVELIGSSASSPGRERSTASASGDGTGSSAPAGKKKSKSSLGVVPKLALDSLGKKGKPYFGAALRQESRHERSVSFPAELALSKSSLDSEHWRELRRSISGGSNDSQGLQHNPRGLQRSGSLMDLLDSTSLEEPLEGPSTSLAISGSISARTPHGAGILQPNRLPNPSPGPSWDPLDLMSLLQGTDVDPNTPNENDLWSDLGLAVTPGATAPENSLPDTPVTPLPDLPEDWEQFFRTCLELRAEMAELSAQRKNGGEDGAEKRGAKVAGLGELSTAAQMRLSREEFMMVVRRSQQAQQGENGGLARVISAAKLLRNSRPSTPTDHSRAPSNTPSEVDISFALQPPINSPSLPRSTQQSSPSPSIVPKLSLPSNTPSPQHVPRVLHHLYDDSPPSSSRSMEAHSRGAYRYAPGSIPAGPLVSQQYDNSSSEDEEACSSHRDRRMDYEAARSRGDDANRVSGGVNLSLSMGLGGPATGARANMQQGIDQSIRDDRVEQSNMDDDVPPEGSTHARNSKPSHIPALPALDFSHFANSSRQRSSASPGGATNANRDSKADRNQELMASANKTLQAADPRTNLFVSSRSHKDSGTSNLSGFSNLSLKSNASVPRAARSSLSSPIRGSCRSRFVPFLNISQAEYGSELRGRESDSVNTSMNTDSSSSSPPPFQSITINPLASPDLRESMLGATMNYPFATSAMDRENLIDKESMRGRDGLPIRGMLASVSVPMLTVPSFPSGMEPLETPQLLPRIRSSASGPVLPDSYRDDGMSDSPFSMDMEDGNREEDEGTSKPSQHQPEVDTMNNPLLASKRNLKLGDSQWNFSKEADATTGTQDWVITGVTHNSSFTPTSSENMLSPQERATRELISSAEGAAMGCTHYSPPACPEKPLLSQLFVNRNPQPSKSMDTQEASRKNTTDGSTPAEPLPQNPQGPNCSHLDTPLRLTSFPITDVLPSPHTLSANPTPAPMPPATPCTRDKNTTSAAPRSAATNAGRITKHMAADTKGSNPMSLGSFPLMGMESPPLNTQLSSADCTLPPSNSSLGLSSTPLQGSISPADAPQCTQAHSCLLPGGAMPKLELHPVSSTITPSSKPATEASPAASPSDCCPQERDAEQEPQDPSSPTLPLPALTSIQHTSTSIAVSLSSASSPPPAASPVSIGFDPHLSTTSSIFSSASSPSLHSTAEPHPSLLCKEEEQQGSEESKEEENVTLPPFATPRQTPGAIVGSSISNTGFGFITPSPRFTTSRKRPSPFSTLATIRNVSRSADGTGLKYTTGATAPLRRSLSGGNTATSRLFSPQPLYTPRGTRLSSPALGVSRVLTPRGASSSVEVTSPTPSSPGSTNSAPAPAPSPEPGISSLRSTSSLPTAPRPATGAAATTSLPAGSNNITLNLNINGLPPNAVPVPIFLYLPSNVHVPHGAVPLLPTGSVNLSSSGASLLPGAHQNLNASTPALQQTAPGLSVSSSMNGNEAAGSSTFERRVSLDQRASYDHRVSLDHRGTVNHRISLEHRGSLDHRISLAHGQTLRNVSQSQTLNLCPRTSFQGIHVVSPDSLQEGQDYSISVDASNMTSQPSADSLQLPISLGEFGAAGTVPQRFHSEMLLERTPSFLERLNTWVVAKEEAQHVQHSQHAQRRTVSIKQRLTRMFTKIKSKAAREPLGLLPDPNYASSSSRRQGQ